jgi:hypothetical protein
MKSLIWVRNASHMRPRYPYNVLLAKPVPLDRHPSEEQIELYASNRLTGEVLERFEEHLLICRRCQDELTLIENIRAALEFIRDTPIHFVHDTSDGLIELRVDGEPGCWRGTIAGQELQSMQKFASIEVANEHVLGWFYQMFPEHRTCTPACGIARVTARPSA